MDYLDKARRVIQIEIDELYVGVNHKGEQFVIPVQAKGKTDKIGVVQIKQDIACCEAKFPMLRCRPIAVQFVRTDLIAMFELVLVEGELRVVDERHYKLVTAAEIAASDLELYARS